MKFLVLWHFELNRLGPEVPRAVMRMPEYAEKLTDKLECRYHVIGSHGGAWIYKVSSNEELDRRGYPGPGGARFVFRRDSLCRATNCAFSFFALPERVLSSAILRRSRTPATGIIVV